MDDDNEAHFEVVFRNCKNDFQLFLSMVGKYLGKKSGFSTFDLTHVSKVLATAAKSCHTVEEEQETQYDASFDADNGTDHAQNSMELNDDNSRDMFETENVNDDIEDNDDRVIPETQMFPEETNDSGESVEIPLYGSKKNNNMVFSDDSDKDDSEFAQVRSDLPASEPNDLQSQLLMANLDRNLLREFDTSQCEDMSTEASSATCNVAKNKAIAESAITHEDDESNKRTDRHESVTPDLDFPTNSNGNEENEEGEENDITDDVTQISQNIFDINTQLINQANSSSDDIFLAATQIPTVASKQPVKKTIQSTAREIETEDDIFTVVTQQASEHNIYDADTQILTINPPSKKISATEEQSGKKKPQKSNQPDVSETQLFDAPMSPGEATTGTNEDLNETSVFDMPTQIMKSKKRFPMVLAENSQPANTPEWSMAARISRAQIERYEKEQEEQRREKLKKHRFLFATSSEEDETDDDLDFDLHRVQERVKVEPQKRRQSVEKSRRSLSKSDDEELPLKKSEPANDASGAKVMKMRRVSVKISREEFTNALKNDMNKTTMTSSNESKPDTDKSSEGTKTKPITLVANNQRNLRKRKQDQPAAPTESPQNKRKTQTGVREEAFTRDKRGKMDQRKLTNLLKDAPKSKSATSLNNPKEVEPKMRNPRKHNAKENYHSSEKIVATMKTSTKPRNSKRLSTRHAILFTKINSAPYTKVIQNLGGYIVDTPQLGNVLICDKIFRTFKFLYALSKGIPIVSPQWLDVSRNNGGFEPTEPYLILDRNSEKRFRFSLRKSLEGARQKPLFTNYHIFATPNVQPAIDEISEIVQCAGGKFADNPEIKRRPDTIAVLITHKKDRKMWSEYVEHHPDIQIVSSEGFMQSVMQQFCNFQDYLLT